MRSSREEIRNAISSGCSEAEFKQMRCRACDAALQLFVHPNGRTFFVRCQVDSTHLSWTADAADPSPAWFEKYISPSGWY